MTNIDVKFIHKILANGCNFKAEVSLTLLIGTYSWNIVNVCEPSYVMHHVSRTETENRGIIWVNAGAFDKNLTVFHDKASLHVRS